MVNEQNEHESLLMLKKSQLFDFLLVPLLGKFVKIILSNSLILVNYAEADYTQTDYTLTDYTQTDYTQTDYTQTDSRFNLIS